jgi:hypothetical protein
VAVVPAPPSRKGGHPVVTANLNNFVIKDDGLEHFVIDGNEYPARPVDVENLRRFVSKNKAKTSTYPHRSLSRDGHLNQILVEITLIKARRENGEPDLWSKGVTKTTESNKKPPVNRYRLANVIFSDLLRPPVLQFGRTLNIDELESRKKTNQKLYELDCTEYNKPSVKEYSELHFPFDVLTKKNYPPISHQLIGRTSRSHGTTVYTRLPRL